MEKSRGYIPISRGIEDHLADFPPSALKLYLWLHLKARYNGSKRGTYAGNFADICAELGMTKRQIQRAASWLRGRYVDYEGARNQAGLTKWTLLKYKGAARDFAGDTNVTSAATLPVTPMSPARYQRGTSAVPATPADDSKQNHLQVPKSGKSGKEGERREERGSAAEKAYEFSVETYRCKTGEDPCWSPLERGMVDQAFADKRDMTAEIWSRNWINYLASTEYFTASKGYSLRHFCKNFDSFRDGPLHDKSKATGGVSDEQLYDWVSRAQENVDRRRAKKDGGKLQSPSDPGTGERIH